MKRFDSQSVYCRMLGHEVPFSYCRTVQGGFPCFRILDCWFEKIPVQDYINYHYSMEEQEQIFKRPDAKMTTLLDLIEKAKSRISVG
ncbi:MAG: hypothetical protein ACQES8_03250 [Thermodesulfobacteriota bacterium]